MLAALSTNPNDLVNLTEPGLDHARKRYQERLLGAVFPLRLRSGSKTCRLFANTFGAQVEPDDLIYNLSPGNHVPSDCGEGQSAPILTSLRELQITHSTFKIYPRNPLCRHTIQKLASEAG